MRKTRVALRRLGLAAIVLVGFAGPASAATSLDSVSASPDVTVELSSTTFDDEDVAVDNLLGIVVPASLGSLPANASVTAYHLLGNGDQLFSLDTAAELAGPLFVEQRDVVRYDGLAYSLEFDGSGSSVPEGSAIDAIAMRGADMLLSFDTTVELPTAVPQPITASDEDLVSFDGTEFSSSLFFDGSAEGVSDAVDLDGVDVLDLNGHYLLSFDTSGRVDGVDFDDEDVLEFDPVVGTWELNVDGSVEHAEWAPADLDALYAPEPGALLMLAVGVGILVVLRSVSRRG